jgi:hypothetical protein
VQVDHKAFDAAIESGFVAALISDCDLLEQCGRASIVYETLLAQAEEQSKALVEAEVDEKRRYLALTSNGSRNSEERIARQLENFRAKTRAKYLPEQPALLQRWSVKAACEYMNACYVVVDDATGHVMIEAVDSSAVAAIADWMVGNWARRSALQQMLNASLKFVVFAIDYRRRFMEKVVAKRTQAILQRFEARLCAKVALR